MPPVGFEPTISGGERPQTYALDRTATGTGTMTWNTKHILCTRAKLVCQKKNVKVHSIHLKGTRDRRNYE